MRESIASALPGSLQDLADRDCPVTRLHAFAKAPRLATCLWRLKYGHDASCYHEALDLLTKALPARRFSLRPSVKRRSAEQALQEWLHESCRTCGGVGSMMVNELVVTCLTCEGHGKHRYSDGERGRHGKLVQYALQVISRFDGIPGPVMRCELERC